MPEPFVVTAGSSGYKTLAECLTDVRDRLDEAGVARFWTDQELRRWIQEGARDIARRAEIILDTEDVAVTASTQEYTLPSNMVRVYRAEWRPTGQESVYPIEYRDFHGMDAVWWTGQETTEGYPSYFTMWGFPPTVTMKLYPTPSTNGVVRVYFYRLPSELATDGTDDGEGIEMPSGWHDLICDYAEFKAMRKDADPRWQEAKALYEQKLGEMVDVTRRWSDQQGYIEHGASVLPGWLWAGEW